MRLIDADALLDKYISNEDKRNNILTARTDYAQGARDIIEDIIDAPTIEPEPKKGRWIVTGTFDDFVKCSCCGYKKLWDMFEMSFCPKCGAKMEEGE